MSNHGLCPSLGINFEPPLGRDGENMESLCSDRSDVKQKFSDCKQGGLDKTGLQPTLRAYPTSKSPQIHNTPSFFTDHSHRGKVPGFRTRTNYHEPHYGVPQLPISHQNINVKKFQFDHPQRYAPYPQYSHHRRIRTPTNLKPSLFARQESPNPSYPQAFPSRSVPSPRFSSHPCRQPYPYPYTQPHPHSHPHPLLYPHPQLRPNLVSQSHDQTYHSQCSCSVCAEVRCCTCNLCRKFFVGFQNNSGNQNCTCQVCVQKLRNQYELSFEPNFCQNQNAHLVQNLHGQNRLMNNFQQIRNSCLHLPNCRDFLMQQQQDPCTCTCYACQQVRHARHAQNAPNVAQKQASQILQTQSLSEERDFYVPSQVSLEQYIQFDFEQSASNELNTSKSNGIEKTDDKQDIHEIFDNLLGHEDDFLDFDATI